MPISLSVRFSAPFFSVSKIPYLVWCLKVQRTLYAPSGKLRTNTQNKTKTQRISD
jgi:hypothetical protein